LEAYGLIVKWIMFIISLFSCICYERTSWKKHRKLFADFPGITTGALAILTLAMLLIEPRVDTTKPIVSARGRLRLYFEKTRLDARQVVGPNNVGLMGILMVFTKFGSVL